MANPDGQVPVNPDAVRAAEERFLLMEAEMRTLREQNETLMRELREQQSVAEAERLRAGRRTQAQVQDFAHLTAELLAARAGPAGNFGGPQMGVKMERPEAFDGAKHQDVDTWLFQVDEHMRMVNVPADRQVAYAASLLRGNAAMWWRERCEAGERAADMLHFTAELRAQFRVENLARRGRDELASIQQYARESVADFLFRFRGICLKIVDLGEHVEYLDFFILDLPKYDVILGKSWLDRWNPLIDWKKNQVTLHVGKRTVLLKGESEQPPSAKLSSLFSSDFIVEQISAQRMRRVS